MEGREKKRKKRRAAAAAVVASAGVMMGGLFHGPEELFPETEDAPPPVAELAAPAEYGEGDDGYGDAEDGEASDEERRRSLPGRLRRWVLRWPAGVRAAVGVPLWCIGWALITLASALWSAVLSPAAGTVLRWVLMAAALLGVFLAVAKAAFPDLPVKKILNRRNLLALLLGTAVLGVLDSVAPLFWEGYERIADLARLALSGTLVGGVSFLFLRRERARRKKAAEKAGGERSRAPEDEQRRALRRVRELADSVK